MTCQPIENVQSGEGSTFVDVKCETCTPGDGYASVRVFCTVVGPTADSSWRKPSAGQAGLDRWRRRHPGGDQLTQMSMFAEPEDPTEGEPDDDKES